VRFRFFVFFFLFFLTPNPGAHAADCDGETATPQRIIQWDIPGDPWGVAVDPQGYVFVTDPINNRICRYSLNGDEAMFFGSYGNDEGEFNEPHWLAFDPVRGRLYVVENLKNPRVQAFDRDGNHLFTIGGNPLNSAPGNFSGNLHALAIDSEGNIYVADWNTFDETFFDRIQVFGPDGLFVRVFQTVVSMPAFPTPGQWRGLDDIEITTDGEVFLLDNGYDGDFRRVHHMNLDGSAIEIWGENGDQPGQFDYPSDLSSDGEFIWVACYQRLMKFQRDGDFVFELSSGDPRHFEALDHHPDASGFFFAGSFLAGLDPERIEVFAPPIPAYNVLDSHWLDASNAFIGDDPALLLDCDEMNLPVDKVVADGVTPVLLSWAFEAPYSVTWSLTDLNPSSVSGGMGELASIDGEQHGDSITITTENVGDRHIAFALYSAPLDFDRAGCPEDLLLEARGVRIYMDYNPVGGGVPGTYFRDLDIVRPPIVFVHGLWSDPFVWNNFMAIRNDPRWTTSDVDYESSHGHGFATNAPIVRLQIQRTRKRLLEQMQTADAQVDLIAHSMGGCLARKIADGPDYLAATNLGRGDFHKLLTLNTPYFGSPMAEAVVSLRSQIPYSRTAIGVIWALSGINSTTFDQILGSAVDDLSPGSEELSAFQALDVPAHAHVGVGGSDLAGTLDIIAGSQTSAATLMTLILLTEEPSLAEFYLHEHDTVVLAESQSGGLGSSFYTVSHNLNGIHTEAPRVVPTGDLALQWAQTPVGDTTFFGTLPAPALSASPNQPQQSTIPDWAGQQIAIDTSSGSGSPGQDISVSATALNGTELSDVIVYYPGGALILESPTFIGTVTIPMDRYGTIPLHALGITSDGTIVESNDAWINVRQTESPVSLSAEPEALVFSGPGEIRRLTVSALFPDGIFRDLTPVASSLDFSGYNSMVIREDEDRSTVQAVRTGSTTLTVEFAGLTLDVPVTVLDGERINNPPHARAGDEYSFCGGEEFCLDGSESFDDDDRWGDVLTYRWDLKGDGIFDDAFGESPCVVIDDGSRDYIAVLEVTDSEGATSIDVAILKPVNGYCQAAATRCEVGQGSSLYEDFAGTADIDVDGSGGFYVLAVPWIWPSDTRIVSFNDQCGFESEFTLDFTPQDIAVSFDGTINMVHYPTQTIRRFEKSGNELAAITLPDIGEDKSYQDGNLEIDPEGNICIEVWENGVGGLVDFEVHIISPNGELVRIISAADDLDIPVSFAEPVQSFEIGPDGAVYFLTDEALYRGTYDDGQYALDLTINLGTFQQSGRDVAVGEDGSIYIVNYHGVHRYLPDGTYDSSRTKAGALPFYELQGVAVDCADRVYLAEQTDNAWVIQFENGGGVIATPSIDDSTVSLTRTFNPTYETDTWTFTWETDIEGDPALDRIYFGDVDVACYDLVSQMTPASVDDSSVVQVGDRFRHTLVWNGIPCIARCSIPYLVESGVACYRGQSNWHTAKILYCLKRM